MEGVGTLVRCHALVIAGYKLMVARPTLTGLSARGAYGVSKLAALGVVFDILAVRVWYAQVDKLDDKLLGELGWNSHSGNLVSFVLECCGEQTPLVARVASWCAMAPELLARSTCLMMRLI